MLFLIESPNSCGVWLIQAIFLRSSLSDTLWASIRMGWNDRKRYQKTRDTNQKVSSGLTFAREVEMLGRFAGRRYSVPNQRRSSILPYTRFSNVGSNDTAFSQTLANQNFGYTAITGDTL